jgi:hypothetical protein
MTKRDLFLAAIRLLREQLGREPTMDDMIAFTGREAAPPDA